MAIIFSEPIVTASLFHRREHSTHQRQVNAAARTPIAFKAAIAGNLEDKIWPLLAEGRIQPVIHQTFPLAEAAAAHRLMESSAHIGTIMLTT